MTKYLHENLTSGMFDEVIEELEKKESNEPQWILPLNPHAEKLIEDRLRRQIEKYINYDAKNKQ